MDQHIQRICPRHSNRLCEAFTYFSSPSNVCLVCIECLSDEDIPSSTLITIDKILNANSKSVIKNWPPLGANGKVIFQNLTDITSQMSSQQNFEKELLKFFDETEKRLIEAIQTKRKDVLKQMGSYSKGYAEIIKEYQSFSEIEQLKSILESKEKSILIEENLKAIIKTKAKEMNLNFDRINSKLSQNCSSFALLVDSAKDDIQKIIDFISSIKFLNNIPNFLNQNSQQFLKIDNIINNSLSVNNKLTSFLKFNNYYITSKMMQDQYQAHFEAINLDKELVNIKVIQISPEEYGYYDQITEKINKLSKGIVVPLIKKLTFTEEEYQVCAVSKFSHYINLEEYLKKNNISEEKKAQMFTQLIKLLKELEEQKLDCFSIDIKHIWIDQNESIAISCFSLLPHVIQKKNFECTDNVYSLRIFLTQLYSQFESGISKKLLDSLCLDTEKNLYQQILRKL